MISMYKRNLTNFQKSDQLPKQRMELSHKTPTLIINIPKKNDYIFQILYFRNSTI